MACAGSAAGSSDSAAVVANRSSSLAVTRGTSGKGAGAKAPAAIQELVKPATGDEGVDRRAGVRGIAAPQGRPLWTIAELRLDHRPIAVRPDGGQLRAKPAGYAVDARAADCDGG